MSAPRPFVSVVVPMRNEAASIRECLGALAAQDYPADRFEVIVADGQSTDGSADLVREAARRGNVRIVPNPRLATPFALNEGIRAAGGEIVVILGARTIVEPAFLGESVSALERSGAEVAGGVMDAIAGETAFSRATAAAVASPFGVGTIAFRQSEAEGFVDTAAYAAYRRTVFEAVGLFDEELVRDQDDEFNYRVRERGGRIFLTPRVRTRYYARDSARGLWRQYFEYGLWKVRVLQKHPRMMQPRHFVPASSVALGLGLLLAAPADGRAFVLAASLASAYAIVVGYASVSAAARIGWSALPALLVAFPVLHWSYGLGSLVGLIRFLPRWWRPEPPPPTL